ncbi:hypothetical protein GQ607_015446 [Colletotrichum asianum]|uniref:Uncharacterized protein n=1 Tax=Colletotrichum asianum TaxID=702518 RepID=A0A8H3ZF45_9PEZI|nr:hypothetical protein GQ607_015446 [Colletotrichum asianum]
MTEVEDAVEDPTSLVQSMLRSICTNMAVSCAREVIPEVHSPHVFTVEFLQPLYLICAFLDISPEGKQLGNTYGTASSWKQPICWPKTYRLEAFLVKQSGRKYELQKTCMRDGPARHVLEIEGLRTELLRNTEAMEALLAENERLQAENERIQAENSQLRREKCHYVRLLESAGVPAPSSLELSMLATADDGSLAVGVGEPTSDYEEDGLMTSSASDQDSSLPDAPALVPKSRSQRASEAAAANKERARRKREARLQARQRSNEIEELLTRNELADVESELRRLAKRFPLEFSVTQRRDTDHQVTGCLRQVLWVEKYVELHDAIDERILPLAGAALLLFKTTARKCRTPVFKGCWDRYRRIHGLFIRRSHALGYNTWGERLVGES